MKVVLSVGVSCAGLGDTLYGGLPMGEHRIDVRMGWTPVRLVGAAVSGAVLFIVLVWLRLPQQYYPPFATIHARYRLSRNPNYSPKR